MISPIVMPTLVSTYDKGDSVPQDRYSIKGIREFGKFFEISIDFDEYISTGHLAPLENCKSESNTEYTERWLP